MADRLEEGRGQALRLPGSCWGRGVTSERFVRRTGYEELAGLLQRGLPRNCDVSWVLPPVPGNGRLIVDIFVHLITSVIGDPD